MNYRKFLLVISALFAWNGLSACDLILPPKQDLEPTILTQTDYAWANIDLLDYYFIGVTRIDCPRISSALTGSGICLPANTVVGSVVNCPLSAPYDQLQFGCLTSDEVPAVYLRLTAAEEAKDIRLAQRLGHCEYAGAGPAAGEEARYKTDPGYKVCLFEGSDTIVSGRLSSEDANARPIGLYVDFGRMPEAEVEVMAKEDRFSGPFTLTLDARYFNDDERERAFKTVFQLLKVYQDSGVPSAESEKTTEASQAHSDEQNSDSQLHERPE